MRTVISVAACLTLAAALAAQTPPTNAKDITELPQTTTATPAPSVAIAAPASVVRVYVANLSGADASALAGLITQALFQSKQVVVTNNQSNASLTLQGSVTREAIRESSATAKRSTRRTRRSASGAASGETTSGSPFGDNAKITELPPLGGNSGTIAAAPAEGSADLLGGSLGLDLTPLGDMNAATDLSHYRYRLNLELVNPGGDLVWMSGQGREALPFEDADDAVARTLAPMLALVHQMSAENAAATSPTPPPIPHP